MSSRVCLMNVPEERAKSEGKLLAGCSDEVLAIYLLNLKQVRRIKKCTTEAKASGGDKDGWQAPYAENRGHD